MQSSDLEKDNGTGGRIDRAHPVPDSYSYEYGGNLKPTLPCPWCLNTNNRTMILFVTV